MNRTAKVTERQRIIKKLIKENNLKNKEKLYSYYKKQIVDHNKKNPNNQIQLVNKQTINLDLKYLEVEIDEESGYLVLPSQVQINNYKKILSHSLMVGNFKISPPIKIVNSNKVPVSKNQLKSLYKIILFCNDANIDIINSIIYKCFPNVNFLGNTVGFNVLEFYFDSLDDSNDFLSKINYITTPKKKR